MIENLSAKCYPKQSFLGSGLIIYNEFKIMNLCIYLTSYPTYSKSIVSWPRLGVSLTSQLWETILNKNPDILPVYMSRVTLFYTKTNKNIRAQSLSKELVRIDSLSLWILENFRGWKSLLSPQSTKLHSNIKRAISFKFAF